MSIHLYTSLDVISYFIQWVVIATVIIYFDFPVSLSESLLCSFEITITVNTSLLFGMTRYSWLIFYHLFYSYLFWLHQVLVATWGNLNGVWA